MVDSLYKRVKFYLTQVSHADGRTLKPQVDDIISFTINLEQVGDIIGRAPTMVVSRTSGATTIFSDAG